MKIRLIGIISLLFIVVYVNFYKVNPFWDLIYYIPNNLIYLFFIVIGLKLQRDLLTQAVLITLGFYYGYELGMDILKIFNECKYHDLYSKKNINYSVSLGIAFSLILLPLLKRGVIWLKKIIKR